jgi:DNA repair protein RadC
MSATLSTYPRKIRAGHYWDRVLTTRLVQAGKLLGIEVLDHIILGEGKYFSFGDEGLLQRDH